MQNTVKKSSKQAKPSESKSKREKTTKDDAAIKPQDEKRKKGVYTISTPRNFLQKSSTADIYGQKKTSAVQSARAPKKPPSASYLTSNPSPMKDLLKSSPSSTSQISTREIKSKMAAQKRVEAKATPYSATPRSRTNVTVNSPVLKRRLNLDREKSFVKDVPSETSTEFGTQRQRTKTRTLEENEVKILTSDAVDNNAEMLNLTKKLTAKPKAFYIDLDGEHAKKPSISKSKAPEPSSDHEVSYEDDFESYESDFDSYHSSSPSAEIGDGDHSSQGDDEETGLEAEGSKEIKDEERMLDSGNFDLRDQRSAPKSKPAVMDHILEASEDAGNDKPMSLTDEGFQEMSSSSAVSSMRTVHVEVLDRPLFMDFSKSRENKRKKRINERLKQRAKDLLSIITLHEMSYNLFEMKPISYDLYMATFGRSNYTQIAVQTFDDGVTEETQTDKVECENKWTQHPVEFSKSDICICRHRESRKYSKNTEDYLTKFTFLTQQTTNVDTVNNMVNIDENYKTNQLRIYLEQKDGVGSNEMLPYETYKTKLVENKYNTHRLGRFLKRLESRISQILNNNKGNSELIGLKFSKFPFSKGYISISTKSVPEKRMAFLNKTSVFQMCYSDTKSNLLMTFHVYNDKMASKNCVICLWDISVAKEPMKILTAVDKVVVGKFRGATDGYFVAALEDGSLHLWDLSEEPAWRRDVTRDCEPTHLVEPNSELTDIEKDREWNLKNSHLSLDRDPVDCALQSCAYTSSAFHISNGDKIDCIVGLELTGQERAVTQDGGRKIVGQVVSLQRTGILTIWTIIQEKSKGLQTDIGKAFSSKMRLERSHTISLLDYIGFPLINESRNSDKCVNFSLNSAKRRLSNRKQEKSILHKHFSRPKSAITWNFEYDRLGNAANAKSKGLPVEKNVLEKWESGVVCYDLKIMYWNNDVYYLVAKNCGEVLCCRKYLGVVKVERLCVADDMTSVTSLEVSPHCLPYFLAACGATLKLCSLLNNRVLLTLDCRNIPIDDVEKCQSDHKGRFVSSVATRHAVAQDGTRMTVTSMSWSRVHPCCMLATLQDGAVVGWQLTHSDIHAKYAISSAACACAASDNTLALLTPDGDVQVHRLTNEQRTREYLQVFEKYIALL